MISDMGTTNLKISGASLKMRRSLFAVFDPGTNVMTWSVEQRRRGERDRVSEVYVAESKKPCF